MSITKRDAKILAGMVKADELKQMFRNAQAKITDWTKTSVINKGMTIGVSFNIYTACEITDKLPEFVKANMIREFGEFIDGYKVSEAKSHKPVLQPTHQEPKSINF